MTRNPISNYTHIIYTPSNGQLLIYLDHSKTKTDQPLAHLIHYEYAHKYIVFGKIRVKSSVKTKLMTRNSISNYTNMIVYTSNGQILKHLDQTSNKTDKQIAHQTHYQYHTNTLYCQN